MSACILDTSFSNFTMISGKTPFLTFGDIRTLVYEDQKNQPPWLVLHRRCRDRPVIQHVPNRKPKVLPYFVKLSTGLATGACQPAVQNYRGTVSVTHLLYEDRAFKLRVILNYACLLHLFFANSRSSWSLFTAPLMSSQAEQTRVH